mmetsp:Transcript_94489/g.273131  ORF Transcript_94489/g.273131 Transcript_94489/m.273131 type:complete len:354 (-) Transcript_94489:12-1073(-)
MSGTYGSSGAYGSMGAPAHPSASPSMNYGSYAGVPSNGLRAPPPASGSQRAFMQRSVLDRPFSEHSILRSGGSSGKLGTLQSHVSVLEFVTLPAALLALVLGSFLQAGTYGGSVSVQIVPVLLVSASVWFTRHHYVRSNNPEVVLGVLCFVAILISTAVGEYAMLTSLQEYRRLSHGASYFNVLPDEAAGGKVDATTLVFANGTRVDTSRTFGFTDVLDPAAPVYCVAPVSSGNLYDKRVQYWAAGLNCCETRSNFNCFRPGSINELGATVFPRDAKFEVGFMKAVKGAQGAYGLTSGDEYLLLTWTKDPVTYGNNLWSGTAMLFGILAVVYLTISAMVGFAVAPLVGGSSKM